MKSFSSLSPDAPDIAWRGCHFSAILLAVLTGALLAYGDPYTQSGGAVALTGQSYSTANEDESGVLVTNSGVFTLSESTVTTSGNTSSSDDSSFYGLNAGVLATTGAAITLTDCTVKTTGAGANGVFAYGTGYVAVVGGEIQCSAQYAHAVMASGGGSLSAENVAMTTAGANSGAIATDRGGGTLTVKGGTVRTSGKDSPGIYSTGIVTITDADIAAMNSEGAVIEGKNSVVLNNTALSGGESDYGGVLILQSMSGDSDVGTAHFTMNGGSLSAPTGSLFFVTNTDTVIFMTGVETAVSSGNLITATATSRWGSSGSNGGDVTFTADTQLLSGDITADDISTISITLQNNSALTGAVNPQHKGEWVGLSLDDSSSWALTSHSFLDSLDDSAGISGDTVTNITGNGFNVYYDVTDSVNTYLNGETYTLVNGGYLMPDTDVDSEEGEIGSILSSCIGAEKKELSGYNSADTFSLMFPLLLLLSAFFIKRTPS